uniref:Venom allergen 3 n=1 Tax=Lygus hesperus TaxID=30085 RepID=A0A0A9WMA7_LYGHE
MPPRHPTHHVHLLGGHHDAILLGHTETMNATVRSLILNWHNDLRDEVAGGALGKTASNMRILSWDFELEQVATRWAHQCLRSKDACRSTEHYQKVGQNVGWVTSHVDSDPPPTEMILKQWAETKRQYYDSNKNTYVKYQRSINPFTIMVRACHEKNWLRRSDLHTRGREKKISSVQLRTRRLSSVR